MFTPLAIVTVVLDRDLLACFSADYNREQEEHPVVVIADNRNKWGPRGHDTHRLIRTVLFTSCQHSSR